MCNIVNIKKGCEEMNKEVLQELLKVINKQDVLKGRKLADVSLVGSRVAYPTLVTEISDYDVNIIYVPNKYDYFGGSLGDSHFTKDFARKFEVVVDNKTLDVDVKFEPVNKFLGSLNQLRLNTLHVLSNINWDLGFEEMFHTEIKNIFTELKKLDKSEFMVLSEHSYTSYMGYIVQRTKSTRKMLDNDNLERANKEYAHALRVLNLYLALLEKDVVKFKNTLVVNKDTEHLYVRTHGKYELEELLDVLLSDFSKHNNLKHLVKSVGVDELVAFKELTKSFEMKVFNALF